MKQRREKRKGGYAGVERQQEKWAYIFLTPNLLFVFLFSFVPVAIALYLSLTRYSILKPPHFLGLANYVAIFRDSVFVRSIGNTVYFLAVVTPVRLILGLVIAILLNQKLVLRNFFRTVVFLPWITSGVVVASIFSWLYDPDVGALNFFLQAAGLRSLYWLTGVTTAMPSIMIAALWRSVGWVVVLYLAGLQGIPLEYYEAARIDGASWWRQLTSVTLPCLRPTTLLIVVTTMIGSFQMFDLVFVMTDGGPLNATTVMAYEIYQNAFSFLKMGYASAESYVLFAIVALLSFVSFRWLRADA